MAAPASSSISTISRDDGTSWAKEADWTRYQARIRDLYGKNTLAEVMEIMQTQYGFKATKKMYKTHITKWALDKKNKECDMSAIARKHADRVQKGKASHFRIRGNSVDYAEVLRYFQRRGESINDVIARRALSKTPEAVECFTPRISPYRSPGVLTAPERMFTTVRDYYKGCFESGFWVAGDGRDSCCINAVNPGPDDAILKLRKVYSLANDLFKKSRFQQGGATLVAAMGATEEIIRRQHPHTIMHLLGTTYYLCACGRREFTLELLRHFSAMAELLLGEKHPLRLVCRWLSSTIEGSRDDVKATIIQSCRALCDFLQENVGPLNRTTIGHRVLLIQLDGYICHEHAYQKLLGEIEGTLGLNDIRTLDVRRALASAYLAQGSFLEAKTLAENTILKLITDWYRPRFLNVLARSRYQLGETWQAEINLQEAIDLDVSFWGLDGATDARKWILLLEDWVRTRCDFEAALQLPNDRL